MLLEQMVEEIADRIVAQRKMANDACTVRAATVQLHFSIPLPEPTRWRNYCDPQSLNPGFDRQSAAWSDR
jgi:hypothetical protein